MRVSLTGRFQDERERYHLACACEECVYFNARAGRCSHGYPVETHRREAFEPAGTLHGMFCKEFEIA